jgi:Ca2+-binding EF-hand superfamily protein
LSGLISRQEFIDYYADVSISIIEDQQFVNLVETTWSVKEDEDAGVFKEELKALTEAVRMKLRVITNQSGEEFVLRTIFKDFDTNHSGNLTLDELYAMLGKLQISVDHKYVVALFKQFDSNNNGLIEFDEFVNYLIYNPYK